LSKDAFSGFAMGNLLFCPLLRTALAGAGSKPARHGVLMLPEMYIAHIFCPPLKEKGAGGMRGNGARECRTSLISPKNSTRERGCPRSREKCEHLRRLKVAGGRWKVAG
jgi:hypothetical protein